jgi:hypothetical protein
MKHTALRVGLQPAHPGQKGMKRQPRHGFYATVCRPCPRYHLGTRASGRPSRRLPLRVRARRRGQGIRYALRRISYEVQKLPVVGSVQRWLSDRNREIMAQNCSAN